MLPSQLIRTGQNLYKTLPSGGAPASSPQTPALDGAAVELQSLVVEEPAQDLERSQEISGNLAVMRLSSASRNPSGDSLDGPLEQFPRPWHPVWGSQRHSFAGELPVPGSQPAPDSQLDELGTDSLLSSGPLPAPSAADAALSAAHRTPAREGVSTPPASSWPVPQPGLSWPAAAGMPAPRRTSDADDALCIICYDQPACMVLLDCGHGGPCKHCSHLLFARPPHTCPVCRRPISAVVELEKRPRVGEVVKTL